MDEFIVDLSAYQHQLHATYFASILTAHWIIELIEKQRIFQIIFALIFKLSGVYNIYFDLPTAIKYLNLFSKKRDGNYFFIVGGIHFKV